LNDIWTILASIGSPIDEDDTNITLMHRMLNDYKPFLSTLRRFE
jgi:hypothetical protein